MTSRHDELSAWAGDHPHRSIGRRIVVARRTASTNDDARRLIKSLAPGAADGYVVTTEEQTDGRGTRGRSWWSPPDRSLAVSFVVSPQPPLAHPAILTIATALSVLHAAAALGAELLLRWPNDVVTPDGAKVAGVLAESIGGERPVHIIGVGINVLEPDSPPPFPVDRPISSVEASGGRVATPSSFFGPLLDALPLEIATLSGDDMRPVVRAFNDASWLSGRPVHVRRGAEERHGVFIGMTPTLELVIEEKLGGRRLWPGEQVELLGWG